MLQDFQKWMVESERLSENTAVQYARRIRQALDLDFDPTKKTAKEVVEFVNTREGSPSTKDHWVGAFRRYEAFLNDQEEDEPYRFASRLKTVRRPDRLPKPIEVDTLDNLLNSIPVGDEFGLRDRAVCELLYCNLRRSEVSMTNVPNFLPRQVTVIGKGNKERIVGMNDTAWFWVTTYALFQHGGIEPDFEAELETLDTQFRELREAVPEDTPMFLAFTGNRLDDQDVYRIVLKAKENAGVKGRVVPHMFRHSYATHLLDNGATDLKAIKDAMGHSSYTMLDYYAKVSKAGRDRINNFHPRQRVRRNTPEV